LYCDYFHVIAVVPLLTKGLGYYSPILLFCSFNKYLGSLDRPWILAVLRCQLNPFVSLSLMLFYICIFTYAKFDTTYLPVIKLIYHVFFLELHS
jgi:hypothetical protein